MADFEIVKTKGSDPPKYKIWRNGGPIEGTFSYEEALIEIERLKKEERHEPNFEEPTPSKPTPSPGSGS